MKGITHSIVTATIMLISITSFGQIEFQNISLEEAKTLSKNTGKDIFIDFRADWCKPCIAMEKETFSNIEVGEAINNKYIPLKFDVDYFNGMDAKETYNVGVLPTILIINSDGAVQRRLLGQKSPSGLMSELDLPYLGGTVVTVDPSDKEAKDPRVKKECFLKRWWRKLVD